MNIGSYTIEWSWQGFSAIISTVAVLVALFGEKIRAWLFQSKIIIREYGTVVPKLRIDLSEKVVYEHYIEIFQSGTAIENARFEVLQMVSNPNIPYKSRPFYPPSLILPMHNGQTLVIREVIKIAEVSSHFDLPHFPVDLGEHPWSSREDDPHYRGRFYTRVIGKNFRSEIWPIDLVKDSNLTSGWRLEVQAPESEKSFFKRRRNYIRDFNEKKRLEGLP